MTNQLTKRALGAGFAAALLLGAAACGDDDDTTTDEDSPGVVDGMGGTDDTDSGFDSGDGLGGTEEDGDFGESGVDGADD